MSVRSAIEDGVIGLLASLAPATIRKAPRPFNQETALDFEQIESIKRLLNGHLPGIIVQTGEQIFQNKVMTRKRSISVMNVELLVAASSLRSREETARDTVAGNAPGIYDVLQAVHGKLHGAQVAVTGVGRLTSLKEGPVVQQPGLCIWLQTYSVDVDTKQNAVTGETDLLEIFSKIDGPISEQTFASGTGDSISLVAGTTWRLTDAAAAFLAGYAGETDITIEGGANAGNRGTFPVTAFQDATRIHFTNAAGVVDGAFTGTWKIHPRARVNVSTT